MADGAKGPCLLHPASHTNPTVDGEGIRMSVRRPLQGENPDVFEITSGPGEVNAWSEARLPFQPKGEMLEFRQRLDAAIRAMPPAGAGHLVATYTAADPNTLIDTENILFYNVGLSCFAAHTRGGLAFERVFAAPPDPPAPASWTPRHHHRYRVTPPPAEFEHWRPVHIAAQWADVPLGPGALAHREMVWAALAHVDTPAEPDGPVHYYAIRIRLKGVEVALANVVKPLIDGVVSSLHCFAGEIPDLVVERLSKAQRQTRTTSAAGSPTNAGPCSGPART